MDNPPEIHYKVEDCPGECQQKEMCGVMREAVELTRTVGKRLGDKDPIFKGLMYLGRASLIFHLNYAYINVNFGIKFARKVTIGQFSEKKYSQI